MENYPEQLRLIELEEIAIKGIHTQAEQRAATKEMYLKMKERDENTNDR